MRAGAGTGCAYLNECKYTFVLTMKIGLRRKRKYYGMAGDCLKRRAFQGMTCRILNGGIKTR